MNWEKALNIRGFESDLGSVEFWILTNNYNDQELEEVKGYLYDILGINPVGWEGGWDGVVYYLIINSTWLGYTEEEILNKLKGIREVLDCYNENRHSLRRSMMNIKRTGVYHD